MMFTLSLLFTYLFAYVILQGFKGKSWIVDLGMTGLNVWLRVGWRAGGEAASKREFPVKTT